MTPGSPTLQNLRQLMPEFTDSELEAIMQDRKRYLVHNFITSGIAPTTMYQVDLQKIAADMGSTAATSQPSVEAKENNSTASQNVQYDRSSSDGTQSEGCKVDHGATRYAKIINQRTGNSQCIEVKEDTGTDVSWVSPQLVSYCNFSIFDVLEENHFLDFGGSVFKAEKRVELSFTGRLEKTGNTEFFVAPDFFPFHGLLVGNRFINSFGHPHNVFLKEPDKTLIMIQKKATVREKSSESSEIEQLTKANCMQEAEHKLIEVGRAQAEKKASELEQNRSGKTQQRISEIQSYQTGQSQLTSTPSRSRSETGTGREQH
ncbi:MAG: hypothetical protein Q9165_004285 [Trypethelium subeluteriae]